MALFKDRFDAGNQLAAVLLKKNNYKYDLVLALPRGGTPVAFEIAKKLNLPLDVFIVRKLGVPGYEELAMGAIASGGVCLVNDEMISELNISQDALQAVIDKELKELERRESTYRSNKNKALFKMKNIIVVDDGIATGASMKAAVLALKKHEPASITIAIPVAEASSLNELKPLVNDIVYILVPDIFYGVGQCYASFPQLTDQEVCKLLR
ncbi:MAG TPA: phosphoribosyltransferase [Coxiellaceae bacterium]|nr:phosphoribosyltransferase [Coxiellaceae bacterium]